MGESLTAALPSVALERGQLVAESPHRWFGRINDDPAWCVAFFRVKDPATGRLGPFVCSVRALCPPTVWDKLKKLPPIELVRSLPDGCAALNKLFREVKA